MNELLQNNFKLLGSILGLLLAFIFLGLGIYGAWSGRVWNGYYGWFYKRKTPFVFWMELTSLFIGSILFALYFGRSLMLG